MEFRLDTFLQEQKETTQKLNNNNHISSSPNYDRFYLLCEEINDYIQEKQEDNSEEWLARQKNAILGYQKEVQFYLNEINHYLKKEGRENVSFPPWYDQLDEAIFHETWGLAGIYEWIKKGKSSSCKVIQPRIYFLEKGKATMQPQQLNKDRFEKLKNTLLLNDTSKRKNAPYQEIYMLDGTRIEIYNNTKENVIIFRRYLVDTFTFGNLAQLGSIDNDSIRLLESMVQCGFNVNMVGPVRSGKTTFLTAYQSYEDPTLEGVLLETDPEIPLHVIMPTAPIIQMIADNEDLDNILKPLMRSDGDYLVMGEARDGRALRQMLMITKKGTRRVKGTFHTGNPEDFCYDIAQEIVNIYGGDVWAYMIQAAKGFQYLFEFASLSHDKSAKRLKGIYEIRFDAKTLQISTHRICHYNVETDDWEYVNDIGNRAIQIGLEENSIALKTFQSELERLSSIKPFKGDSIIHSAFSKLIPIGNGV